MKWIWVSVCILSMAVAAVRQTQHLDYFVVWLISLGAMFRACELEQGASK
jgi:hypothetical protein